MIENFSIYINERMSVSTKKLSGIILSILFVLLAVTSCSDDFFNREHFSTTTESGNVMVYIPSVKGVAKATRVDESDEESSEAIKEGTIKSLLLFAYPADEDSELEAKCFVLGEPTTLTQEYSQYPITLEPGRYRVYLVGNLDEYLDEKITKSISEDDLKSKVLHFGSDKLPNLTDGLPMAAFPEDILEQENGVVEVKAVKGATITANMKFLCAKVRLTLFFNKATESSYSYPGFKTNHPILTGHNPINVADGTYIDEKHDANHGYFTAEGSFQRMEYPDGLDDESDIRDYNDLDKMSGLESVTPDDKMVWRTTLYLPENLTTDPSKATVLYINAQMSDSGRKFRYKVALPGITGEGAALSAQPLRRAYFHDLTACIKSVGGEFEINSDVIPWTVNTLVHDLHGPYFLKVGNTEHVPVTAGEETHLWYSSDVPVHFESQQEMVNGEMKNVLIIEKMKNHENDSIVITANPLLPIDFDLSESYFYVLAGNIKKKIRVWPFTIKPFFNVTPQYSAIEVREQIESGSNTLNLPIHFTTNLEKVSLRLVDGWDEEENMPVEFKLSSACDSQHSDGVVYEGVNAHDGYNTISMQGFVKGNSYWTEGHNLTIEYTAYKSDGSIFDTRMVEVEIFPKRYTYRIYFRPENDDWATPHVYICEILALPFVLDKSLVKDEYKDRAGKPVGGHLYTPKTDVRDYTNWEGGLRYSYTGKISFRGWSTQGGPAINDPYAAVALNPKTEAQGFYTFGKNTMTVNGYLYTSYGISYIPPSSPTDWGNSGGMEAEIRARYDIETDLMASHRAKVGELCPLCTSATKYNMKFPGICMLRSQKYPGWWYVDLTEVADPGKTLIMFHDGHSDGTVQVPGAFEPGMPLFDFADNEGWFLYREGGIKQFVDNRPSVSGTYSENTYRIFWQRDLGSDLQVQMYSAAGGSIHGVIKSSNGPGSYGTYNTDYIYMDFKLSGKLANRKISIKQLTSTGNFSQEVNLSDFQNVGGIYCYTMAANPSDSHAGQPQLQDKSPTKYRLYWPQSNIYKGFNVWLTSGTQQFVFNNFDNGTQSYISSLNYKSGSRTIDGIPYDYYEFHIMDDPTASGGWQMHTTSGTYQNQININYNSFTTDLGDGCKSIIRKTELYNSKDFRIYWPSRYNNAPVYLWLYGFADAPGNESTGPWISDVAGTYSNVVAPSGIITIDGIEYCYWQFPGGDNGLPEASTGSAGIMARTAPNWGVGSSVGTSGTSPILYNRYLFKYNSTRGVNEIFVNNTFTGLK